MSEDWDERNFHGTIGKPHLRNRASDAGQGFKKRSLKGLDFVSNNSLMGVEESMCLICLIVQVKTSRS